MEYSLHKQLKERYCGHDAEQEVVLGDYRIDVVDGKGTLIEIQHSSLSAIKMKCHDLLEKHKLLVVKPIIRCKQLIKLKEKEGRVVSNRQSPKRGSWLTAFEELVYFRGVFPHPNLVMDFLLVDIQETRYPGHGKRRRRRDSDFQVQDLELKTVVEHTRISQATDLFQWLPFENIPRQFDTEDLAGALNIDRTDAQRIAYCLREMGAVRSKGKRGRSNFYERPVRRKKKRVRGKGRQDATVQPKSRPARTA